LDQVGTPGRGVFDCDEVGLHEAGAGEDLRCLSDGFELEWVGLPAVVLECREELIALLVVVFGCV
jgi:hypothetical protein